MNAQIYLMRHGPAEERDSTRYPDDRMRPLTADGAKRTRQLARALRSIGVVPDLLLTSPLVRAQQTAAIVGRALDRPVQSTEALAPGGAPDAVLAAMGPVASAILVGHEPDLSELLSYLMTADLRRVRVEFKKGAVARVDMTDGPGSGVLGFLIPPRVLRRVG